MVKLSLIDLLLIAIMLGLPLLHYLIFKKSATERKEFTTMQGNLRKLIVNVGQIRMGLNRILGEANRFQNHSQKLLRGVDHISKYENKFLKELLTFDDILKLIVQEANSFKQKNIESLKLKQFTYDLTTWHELVKSFKEEYTALQSLNTKFIEDLSAVNFDMYHPLGLLSADDLAKYTSVENLEKIDNLNQKYFEESILILNKFETQSENLLNETNKFINQTQCY